MPILFLFIHADLVFYFFMISRLGKGVFLNKSVQNKIACKLFKSLFCVNDTRLCIEFYSLFFVSAHS